MLAMTAATGHMCCEASTCFHASSAKLEMDMLVKSALEFRLTAGFLGAFERSGCSEALFQEYLVTPQTRGGTGG